MNYNGFIERIKPFELVSPRLIHLGSPVNTDFVLRAIEVSGHGAIDPAEGAIWRVERKEREHPLQICFQRSINQVYW